MDDPILITLLAVATNAPLIVTVDEAFTEPRVKAPLLLNVVAEPMVELDPLDPKTSSNVVAAVFSELVFTEPVIVIFPVCAPSVNCTPPEDVMVA